MEEGWEPTGQHWLRWEATPDQAGDQAVTLNQCSRCGGVCCSGTAPALAGLEGFPSIMAGMAEWWGAPGFPLLTSPRRSPQPPLLLLPPLSPAAGQGRFLLLPLQTTPTPHHGTMLSPKLSHSASGNPSIFSSTTCCSPALLQHFPATFLQTTVLWTSWGEVLLILVLAPGLNRDRAAWSSSCLLDGKAARDRDLTQSNYPNL